MTFIVGCVLYSLKPTATTSATREAPGPLLPRVVGPVFEGGGGLLQETSAGRPSPPATRLSPALRAHC